MDFTDQLNEIAREKKIAYQEKKRKEQLQQNMLNHNNDLAKKKFVNDYLVKYLNKNKGSTKSIDDIEKEAIYIYENNIPIEDETITTTNMNTLSEVEKIQFAQYAEMFDDIDYSSFNISPQNNTSIDQQLIQLQNDEYEQSLLNDMNKEAFN